MPPPPSTPAAFAVADKMAKCDETAATDEITRHGCDVTAEPALGPEQCKTSLATDLKIPDCHYQPPWTRNDRAPRRFFSEMEGCESGLGTDPRDVRKLLLAEL